MLILDTNLVSVGTELGSMDIAMIKATGCEATVCVLFIDLNDPVKAKETVIQGLKICDDSALHPESLQNKKLRGALAIANLFLS